MESVYSAVRTDALYKARYVSIFKSLRHSSFVRNDLRSSLKSKLWSAHGATVGIGNSVLSVCCQCAVSMLSVCCQYAVSVLPVCCQCAVSMLSVCCQYAVSVLPVCCQCAASMLSVCCQYAVSVLSVCCQCAVSMLSVCCQYAVSMLTGIQTKRCNAPWFSKRV